MELTSLPCAATEHHDVSPLEMERLRVQEEISSLFAQIYKLRSYLNALSPFAKLPPEILSRIFLTLMQSLNYANDGVSYDWVVVTTVCRQWREIALQTASLWTVVNPTHAQWTKLLLERSRSAPLSLVVLSINDIDDEAMGLTVRNIHRFSSLKTPVLEWWDEVVGTSERRALPLLKDIDFVHSHLVEALCDPREMSPIFDRLEFPNLQSLRFSGLMLEPSSPLFARSLTSLTFDTSQACTIPIFLEILSETPALSHLTVCLNLTVRQSEIHLYPVPPAQRVDLPYLKSLFVNMPEEPMQTVCVLNHLGFPSWTSVQVSLADVVEGSSEAFYQGLQPTLLGQNRIGPVPKYHTCVFDLPGLSIGLLHDRCRPAEEVLVADFNHLAEINHNEAGIFASMGVVRRALEASLILFEFVRRGSLEDLTSLSIDDALGSWSARINDAWPLDWHSIIASMPNLTRIQVRLESHKDYDYYWRFFSRVLLLSDNDDPDAEDSEASAENSSTSPTHQQPVLLHLKIFVVSMLFNEDSLDALLEILERRRSSGAPAIGRLVLEGRGDVEAEDVEQLREFVGDVIQVCSHSPAP